jgi:GntR family transcriptional regulator
LDPLYAGAVSTLTGGPLEGASPLYSRVYRAIAEQIATGALRPHDRLPTERAIAETLEVSRVTVRRALQELMRDGLVEPAAGRGYLVASKVVTEPENALLSFTSIGIARGLVPSSRVLESVVRPATIDEAEQLRIAPGGAVFVLERIRCLDGIPIALSQSRLPHARVPRIEDVDFTTASLYEVLATRWSIIPTRSNYLIEAVGASEAESQHLEVGLGTPLLAARETMYDQHGTLIDLARIAYRGDRYRFETTLARPPAPPG